MVTQNKGFPILQPSCGACLQFLSREDCNTPVPQITHRNLDQFYQALNVYFEGRQPLVTLTEW